MKFNYTAQDQQGKRQTGTLVAESALSAGHQLKEQGLTPLELKEDKPTDWSGFLELFGSVPLAEKLVFVENLELLLKSGVPVARSMSILTKQTRNRKFAKVINELHDAVENGTQLNEAMAKYPKIFSDIFVSMIKVGEMSGTMETSLKQLGVQLEREADLRSRVKGAMMYPMVILVAMIVMGVAMATFVLPKLTSVFKEFDAEIPAATRVVIGITDFFSSHPVVVMGIMILALLGAALALRSRPGKQLLGVVALKLPGIGPLAIKINIARFTRVLSSLLSSGIPIVEALSVAGQSIPNVRYKESLLATAERVKLGKSLTDELGQYEHLYPFLVVQMLSVGEETGSLEDILVQIASHFESQVDATLKNLSSIIEPLLLIVIGAVVGALAYALIMPIYNMGSAIQ